MTTNLVCWVVNLLLVGNSVTGSNEILPTWYKIAMENKGNGNVIFISISGKECPALESTGNGTITGNGNQPGDKVTFKCDDGYSIVGENVLTCQENGAWSSGKPTCQEGIHFYIIYFNFKISFKIILQRSIF